MEEERAFPVSAGTSFVKGRRNASSYILPLLCYAFFMDYPFALAILALLFIVLILVRRTAKYIVQKQPPEEPEEQRYFDHLEIGVLHHRKATYVYSTVALLTIGAILFFWIKNIRSVATMGSSSLTTLAWFSVWGAFFLPFFSKLRLLAPEDRTRVRRFIFIGIVLGVVVLITALIVTFPR